VRTYDAAPEDVHARVRRVIQQFHPDLKTSEARIDLIYVYADEDQPALMCHGYPADAVIRITSAKERAIGRGDAEIVIDRDTYKELSAKEQDALIDHELYHLKVKKDRHGIIQVDDHRRPKLNMRRHDREYGWFDEIARRHGEASGEIRQARKLLTQEGQLYFELSAPSEVPDLHA
jgi:hypothetical protein